jgi:hypothetical protein
MCRQTRLRPQLTESAAHTGEGEKGEPFSRWGAVPGRVPREGEHVLREAIS